MVRPVPRLPADVVDALPKLEIQRPLRPLRPDSDARDAADADLHGSSARLFVAVADG